LRQKFLAELSGKLDANRAELKDFLESLLSDDHVGRSKLFTVWRTLQCLGRNRSLFADGSYVPLRLAGSKANHICAFARVLEDRAAVIIVPILVATLTGGEKRVPAGLKIWQDTTVCLPETIRAIRYENVFSGELLEASKTTGDLSLDVGLTLNSFPVALLEGT
jgi:(1->4)-alpha-D-glucan 1-alpha-D-glucosylmutase